MIIHWIQNSRIRRKDIWSLRLPDTLQPCRFVFSLASLSPFPHLVKGHFCYWNSYFISKRKAPQYASYPQYASNASNASSKFITLFISLVALSVFFDTSLNSTYYPFNRLFFYPTLSIYGYRLDDNTINPRFYTPFLRILEYSPPWNLYRNLGKLRD